VHTHDAFPACAALRQHTQSRKQTFATKSTDQFVEASSTTRIYIHIAATSCESASVHRHKMSYAAVTASGPQQSDEEVRRLFAQSVVNVPVLDERLLHLNINKS